MKNIKLSITLFWVFFLLLILLTVGIPLSLGINCEFMSFNNFLFIRNVVAFTSTILFLLCLLFHYQFRKELKGDLNLPVSIKKIQNVNYSSFVLLGFHTYRVDMNHETLKNKICISKEKIRNQDKVKYLKISEKIYFAEKA